MTRYSLQPGDRIFLKGYGFMSFAKNIGRNNGKNISQNLSSKYNHKLLGHAKTASKIAIQKTTEAASDLTGNKIADKTTRASKTSAQSNLEANEEILGERYISPELRQKIIDDLRLKEENY